MLPKDPIIATATAVAVAAARHSPLATTTPRSLRGFIVVIVVIVVIIVTAVTTVVPPLFCDLFDCCICSVVVSSPLPHPVVAIPPTASLSSPTTPPPRDQFDCCVHVLVPRHVVSP